MDILWAIAAIVIWYGSSALHMSGKLWTWWHRFGLGSDAASKASILTVIIIDVCGLGLIVWLR